MTVHTEHMRVAWSDTDAGGRIHWSSVFRWAETAEHAFLRTLGWQPHEIAAYPRRATQAAYHRPLHFGDPFEVHLGIDRLGTTSVTFGWTITSNGETCVTGSHTVVHVDPTGHPTPWPDRFRSGNP